MGAVAAPLLPEQIDAWKAWAAELTGPRREEFDDFNRRMQLTAHRVWLFQSPQGPLAIVIHDGPGGDAFVDKLAKSDHPFDGWFRDSISTFHGIDFSSGMPGPPAEPVLDWTA